MPSLESPVAAEPGSPYDVAHTRDAHLRATVVVAMAAFFVTALDAQVVNVALPAVGRALRGDVSGLQWVVTGYTLTYSVLLLFAGTLSDRVGATRAYIAGMAVFTLASAACGLAPTLGLLVVARLAQGAGAAVLTPASLALIREGFVDPAARARAIAWWGLGGAVAAASGPIVGGLLTGLGWRLVFFVNIPVGVAVLLLVARVPSSPRRPARFDVTGQVAAVVALGSLTYAVIEGPQLGWGSRTILALLALTALAGAVFVHALATGVHPMVPPRLVASGQVRVALAVAFMTMAGFYGVVFVQSLYLQQVRHESALTTGLLFVPMTAVIALSQITAARLATRFGPRLPVVAGLMAEGLGLWLLVVLPVTAPVWVVALAMMPVGIGGAAALPPVVALLLDHAPAELAGTASGVLNTVRQVGGSLGVAAIGAVLTARGAFVPGLRLGLGATAVLLVLTAGLALKLHRTPRVLLGGDGVGGHERGPSQTTPQGDRSPGGQARDDRR